jgi:hypothetical protein
MFPGFAGDCIQECLAKRIVRVTDSQGRVEVKFAVVPEAGSESGIGGETHFVTVVAEMEVCQSADETDDRAGNGKAVIFGGTVSKTRVGQGNEFVALSESADDLADGQEIRGGEQVAGREGHEFDQA